TSASQCGAASASSFEPIFSTRLASGTTLPVNDSRFSSRGAATRTGQAQAASAAHTANRRDITRPMTTSTDAPLSPLGRGEKEHPSPPTPLPLGRGEKEGSQVLPQLRLVVLALAFQLLVGDVRAELQPRQVRVAPTLALWLWRGLGRRRLGHCLRL